MAVLVLDKRKTPLMSCSEKRARLLLGLAGLAVGLRVRHRPRFLREHGICFTAARY